MIGKKIKEIRTLLGLSQTEFAKKVGISGPGLCQIEKGKRKPAYNTLNRIIKRLSINPKALF